MAPRFYGKKGTDGKSDSRLGGLHRARRTFNGTLGSITRRGFAPQGSGRLGTLFKLFRAAFGLRGWEGSAQGFALSVAGFRSVIWMVMLALSVAALPGVLLFLKAPRACGVVLLASGALLLSAAFAGIQVLVFPGLYLALPGAIAVVGGAVAISHGQKLRQPRLGPRPT